MSGKYQASLFRLFISLSESLISIYKIICEKNFYKFILSDSKANTEKKTTMRKKSNSKLSSRIQILAYRYKHKRYN